MTTRSIGKALGGLLLRFPATALLLTLVTLASTELLEVGPGVRVVLLAALPVFYMMDLVGALATYLGLPCPGPIEVGVLFLGSLLLDGILRRAWG